MERVGRDHILVRKCCFPSSIPRKTSDLSLASSLRRPIPGTGSRHVSKADTTSVFVRTGKDSAKTVYTSDCNGGDQPKQRDGGATTRT